MPSNVLPLMAFLFQQTGLLGCNSTKDVHQVLLSKVNTQPWNHSGITKKPIYPNQTNLAPAERSRVATLTLLDAWKERQAPTQWRMPTMIYTSQAPPAQKWGQRKWLYAYEAHIFTSNLVAYCASSLLCFCPCTTFVSALFLFNGQLNLTRIWQSGPQKPVDLWVAQSFCCSVLNIVHGCLSEICTLLWLKCIWAETPIHSTNDTNHSNSLAPSRAFILRLSPFLLLAVSAP